MSLDLELIIDRRVKRVLGPYETQLQGQKKQNEMLRKQVDALTRTLETMQKQYAGIPRLRNTEPLPEGAEFSAEKLRAHRANIGVSAQDYARLAGVSAISIYKWESSRAFPRRAQQKLLAKAGGLSKAQALEKLSKLRGR